MNKINTTSLTIIITLCSNENFSSQLYSWYNIDNIPGVSAHPPTAFFLKIREEVTQKKIDDQNRYEDLSHGKKIHKTSRKLGYLWSTLIFEIGPLNRVI